MMKLAKTALSRLSEKHRTVFLLAEVEGLAHAEIAGVLNIPVGTSKGWLFEARRGMTLDDLAEECGVDRRTIHRDLNAVEEAGYTLTSEWLEGKKVYSFLTKSRNIPPITFTLPQLMSLYLLRSLGVYLAGTPFQAEIEELFRTITSVLPDRYAAHLERIARVSLPILHGARDYSAAAGYLEELQRALLHQYRVRLSYAKKGRDEHEAYEIDP